MIKIKHIITLSTLLISLNTNLLAESHGKKLFEEKCISCHSINMPKSKADLKAPPAVGLMFHLTENFSNDEQIQKHIESYVINPTRETAICKSIRRFGIMPSQKGNVTKEELKIIAEWLIDDISISRREYKRQKKEMFAN